MAVDLVRPDVSDLVLRTYGRALHPELFENHCRLVQTNSGIKLDAKLGPSGHALLLTIGDGTITEVIAHRQAMLPERERITDCRLRGSRNEFAELNWGLRYDMSFQVERLHMDIFLRIDEELEQDVPRADLSTRLPAANRFLPGPLSLIRAEVGRDSILVYTFHTFPEHSTVVKTQSLFEKKKD